MENPLCMFCGDEIMKPDLTREHFVPKGLWPKGSRPLGVKTCPAHRSCNSGFSGDNEYFRDVMALEEGADHHPAIRDLREGTLRRKIDERAGSIAKTLKNLRMRPARTLSGIVLPSQPSFELDWERIKRVICNVMKGVFYVCTKQPMPQNFIFSVSDANLANNQWDINAAKMMVPWQSFGDSVFRCRYVVSQRNPIEKIACLMQFYEHRLFIGEAIAPEVIDNSNDDLFVPVAMGSSILVPRWCAEQKLGKSR